MLRGVIGFIFGMFLSFLPPRYRSRFSSYEGANLRNPAWVSGFVQVGGALLFLIVRLYTFMMPGVDSVSAAVVQEASDQSMPVNQMIGGTGIIVLANFALEPVHLLAYFFIVEGVVRILSAGISGQPVGTLPLYFVSGVHNWLEPRWRERRMGERVVDEIVKGDGETFEWKILSCRPKPDWHRNITVRYQDRFYQMFKEETGLLPRPFVYCLRNIPIGHLVVIIREYNPTDVLKKPE